MIKNSYCPLCSRKIQNPHETQRTHRPIVGVYAVHEMYGCESGCCGHQFYALDDQDTPIRMDFSFMHDEVEEDLREFAEHFRVPILVDRNEIRPNCDW
jgi:hypothetical protein